MNNFIQTTINLNSTLILNLAQAFGEGLMIKLKDKNLFYLRGFYLLLAVYIFLKTAWLSDDSFITLNQVWNFINGEGIVWNSNQRVQAFTHPLWFLMLSSVSFFTRELFFTNLVTSFVCSMTSIIILFNLFFKKHTSVSQISILIIFSIFVPRHLPTISPLA